MSLAKKLNLKDGAPLRVVGMPAGVDLDDVTTTSSDKGAVLLFAKNKGELDAKAVPVIEAARQDRIAWIAYPKAGQVGTDLSRDILWKHLHGRGIQGVRQIAIDEVWSALRFRPGAE